jgi:monoamine oxidase
MSATPVLKECDVAVIGAGMSGLYAARHLARAGKNVLVLEARDRVGGRTYSTVLPSGISIDLGGQWIGPTQKRMMALVEEYGLETYQTYDQGAAVALLNGEVNTYTGIIPQRDPQADEDIGNAVAVMDELAASIPLAAPWTHPRARELDKLTFRDWIEQQLKTEYGRWCFTVMAAGVFSVEACELSLLHVAFYFGSAGGMGALTSTTGGAQDRLFRKGAQQLTLSIAKELGDAVLFNHVVNKIEHSDAGVVIYTDGSIIKAKRLIVALSPALAARIRYSPPLPPMRDLLTQRMPMGTALKLHIIYKEPFWRKEGLSGLLLTDAEVPQFVYDSGAADVPWGHLVGFAEGSSARKWCQMTQEEREVELKKTLVKCLGPQAADYVEYVEQNWFSEEFSRGCYAGTMPPGAWTDFGPHLTRPVGAIHWAGTETATEWSGYIEGAAQAGERAANEILALL